MKKVSLVVALCALGACAGIQLKPGAEKISVSKDRPAGSCKDLGEVFGKGNGIDLQKAMVEAQTVIKNEAADRHATHVVLETNNSSYDAESLQNLVVLSGHAVACN
jgi:hypothetical protein